jgi:hypothetical protein
MQVLITNCGMTRSEVETALLQCLSGPSEKYQFHDYFWVISDPAEVFARYSPNMLRSIEQCFPNGALQNRGAARMDARVPLLKDITRES